MAENKSSRSRKPMIAHVIDSFARGGAEGVVVETIKSLPDSQHLLVLLNGPKDLCLELSGDVTCLDLQHRGHRYLLSTALRLRTLLRTHEVTLVHTHLYWATLVGRLAVGQRLPLVTTYHFADYDTMRENWKVQVLRRLDVLTYRSSYFTVAVSQYIKQVLTDRCGFTQRLSTIHNSIRDEFYQSATLPSSWTAPATLRVVAVGNIKAEKNYELLLEAAALLRGALVQIDIYGTGPLLADYQRQVQELGLPNIAFLGRADNVSALFLNYHLYTMTSFSESFGLTPVEAMAVGLPVLLSDIPALREVGGEAAIFFQNRSASAWVAAVQAVLDGQLNLAERQSAARQQAKLFSKERFVRQLTQLYEEALATD